MTMRRILAILFIVGPFVAGAIGAASARHDLRLLWMGITATPIAWLVTARLAARATTRVVVASAGIAATAAATVVAVALGARSPVGVLMVAVVVSAFATTGAVLWRRCGEMARNAR